MAHHSHCAGLLWGVGSVFLFHLLLSDSYICSPVNKHLLSTYYVPDTMAGAVKTEERLTVPVPEDLIV